MNADVAEHHTYVKGTEAPEPAADVGDLESPDVSKGELTEGAAIAGDIVNAESITQALVRYLSNASRFPCQAASNLW
jgi:hypothetical protein